MATDGIVSVSQGSLSTVSFPFDVILSVWKALSSSEFSLRSGSRVPCLSGFYFIFSVRITHNILFFFLFLFLFLFLSMRAGVCMRAWVRVPVRAGIRVHALACV